MALYLYFDQTTGCLVGINLNREPTDQEILVEYNGSWPPPGYTYRLNLETNEVSLVPIDECESGTLLGNGESHPYAEVWLSRTAKVPTRGAFGVPFDSVEDPYGLILDLVYGVPVLKPGRYHVWGQVTYSVIRHFSIISRDLLLLIEGREVVRNSISIYTRGQFTQSIGPVNVILPEDRNAVGVISEPTVSAYLKNYRPRSYPVVIVGGRSFTRLSIERVDAHEG